MKHESMPTQRHKEKRVEERASTQEREREREKGGEREREKERETLGRERDGPTDPSLHWFIRKRND